jgi:hypothetical protein
VWTALIPIPASVHHAIQGYNARQKSTCVPVIRVNITEHAYRLDVRTSVIALLALVEQNARHLVIVCVSGRVTLLEVEHVTLCATPDTVLTPLTTSARPCLTASTVERLILIVSSANLDIHQSMELVQSVMTTVSCRVLKWTLVHREDARIPATRLWH